MLTVGDKFPDLHMKGVNEENEIIDVDVVLPEWTVVYFYPKDFTFICPTEISAMDELSTHCDVIGVRGDNEFCKLAWKMTILLFETLITFLQQTAVFDFQEN